MRLFLRVEFINYSGHKYGRKKDFARLARLTKLPLKTVTKLYYNDRQRNSKWYQDVDMLSTDEITDEFDVNTLNMDEFEVACILLNMKYKAM